MQMDGPNQKVLLERMLMSVRVNLLSYFRLATNKNGLTVGTFSTLHLILTLRVLRFVFFRCNSAEHNRRDLLQSVKAHHLWFIMSFTLENLSNFLT